MDGEHWEYTTCCVYVRNDTPWPMRMPNVMVGDSWSHDQKIITIQPFHTKYSAELEVWWIERKMVKDTLPAPDPPNEYENLKAELGVV